MPKTQSGEKATTTNGLPNKHFVVLQIDDKRAIIRELSDKNTEFLVSIIVFRGDINKNDEVRKETMKEMADMEELVDIEGDVCTKFQRLIKV